MAWGRTPSEERAASEAAQLAAERAHLRAQMSPFERQVLDLLAGIRDALVALGPPDSEPTQPNP